MEENIVITRRRTSRVSIRIGQSGEVRVSAPWFYPKSQILDFVAKNSEWIKKAREKLAQNVAKRNDFYDKLPLSTREEQQAAYEKLVKIIAPMYEKYSSMMGVRPMQIVFSATKSKWGSCYPTKNRLQFSLYLLLLPEWCIESVVVHELCHVFVPNHSAKFYELMDKYFPLRKEADKEIKRIRKQ